MPRSSANNIIHPTAIIADSVKIGVGVKIGAYTVISGEVSIGDHCEIKNSVTIEGRTTIGSNCKIYPYSLIGVEPQDLKYQGEDSATVIGDNTVIREHVTIHRGTKGDNMLTCVGSDCLIMVCCHIAHDCVVGNNVIMANNATLAGHVHVGDRAVIGGLTGIHQFIKIGELAMIGAFSMLVRDVPPFTTVVGDRPEKISSLNYVGLNRAGIAKADQHALRHAIKILSEASPSLEEQVAKLEQISSPYVKKLREFIIAEHKKGMVDF
jgi:UDP-N-acetylglucosamine acyltransferase